jgi:hypothetical protein
MKRILLILVILALVGCATPVKQDCPICPEVKCPAVMVDNDVADRLEIALLEALDDYEACERAFNQYQRKSR